jgi:hypothetical protein
MVFADIAEQLYNANSLDDVLSRIAEAAVLTIDGCRMASVTLSGRSGHRTAASTDPAATAVDQVQYESNEGPCLDAVDSPMVYAQSFPDERWPTLASRPTESGVQSALSYRLAAASSATAESDGGSLNSYGVIPLRIQALRGVDSSWPRTPRWRLGQSMNAAPFKPLSAICSRPCSPETSSARPKES